MDPNETARLLIAAHAALDFAAACEHAENLGYWLEDDGFEPDGDEWRLPLRIYSYSRAIPRLPLATAQKFADALLTDALARTQPDSWVADLSVFYRGCDGALLAGSLINGMDDWRVPGVRPRLPGDASIKAGMPRGGDLYDGASASDTAKDAAFAILRHAGLDSDFVDRVREVHYNVGEDDTRRCIGYTLIDAYDREWATIPQVLRQSVIDFIVDFFANSPDLDEN